jgi:ABC-2 type transport system permease protein
MAVYERRFEPYDGPLTTASARRWVIPRFAFAEILRSRIALITFVAGFAVPVACGAVIYARQNATVLELFGDEIVRQVTIGTDFFTLYLILQGWLALVLALVVGPPLVARDMTDNALPLYLSRPLSRLDYGMGKLLVLLAPLSAITWMPALLLGLLQYGFDGSAWWTEHGRAVWATVAGSWALILPLSLVTLALSSVVQRRWVARGLMLGAVFVSRGMAEAINGVLDTRWGYLISPTRVLGSVWSQLFDGGTLLTITGGRRMPPESGWAVLALVCVAGAIVLASRIRAYEEVRT